MARADHESGGLLSWREDGGVLESGRYRIHLLGPYRWELTRRGRVIGVHRRLSTARRLAELDHRESLRRRDIEAWGATAAIALIAAGCLVLAWGTVGFFGLVAAVFVMCASIARLLAALSRSTFDPYRRRDPWEARDWWNGPW